MRSLDHSTVLLSCLAYNLLRSIELCSSWLLPLSSCEAKIRLGREIGAYAAFLAQTANRMFDLCGANSIAGRSEDAHALRPW